VQVPGDALPVLDDHEFGETSLQACGLDRGCGRCRQRNGEFLVTVGELTAPALVGEVEVAEDGAPDADRHAEERRHVGVPRRKAVAVGVACEVGES
jgi:hypothetical protein